MVDPLRIAMSVSQNESVLSARTDNLRVPRLAFSRRLVVEINYCDFFFFLMSSDSHFLGRTTPREIFFEAPSAGGQGLFARKKGKTHERISSLLLKKRRIAHRKCLKEVRD